MFGTGSRLFATFDNFVVGKTGFSEAGASRKVIAAGYRNIVIQTADNDWYLNDELEDLLVVLRQQTCFALAKGLGFSMGAFGALIFAEALRLKELVLVSPRFPRPFDWPGQARINCSDALLNQSWRDRLTRAAAVAPQSLVLFDPRHFDDRMAARWLARSTANVSTLAVAFGGHPCTKYINESGNFGNLQRILLGEGDARPDIVDLKRIARGQSEAYGSRLADYLNQRKRRAAAE